MSARGRGRGRGIPIAYPDGWACKPPSASLPTWTPSQPFVVSAADREMLDQKRVLHTPSLRPLCVGVDQPSSDLRGILTVTMTRRLDPFINPT